MQWSQNLCRVCGQISETCHLIYNKDEPSTLENKIKKCLNLNLYKGDYKPKQICNNCVVKLNEFSDFIEVSYATNQKFESIYFNTQSWHHNNNRNYEYPAQKQSVIVSNKQAPDNLDFELYKNTGVVLENINFALNDTDVLDFVGNGDYNQQEPCNNYTNVTDTKLRGHYTTVLRHANIEATQVNCNTANFTDQQNLEKNTQVTNCNDKTCYVRYSNNYNETSSLPSTNLDCGDEGKSVPKNDIVTVESLRKTIKLPPNSKAYAKPIKRSYPCPQCDKKYLRRSTLNTHIATHTNVRPYKCEQCSKAFAIKSTLTTHKKMHTDQHKCSFCSKKFSVPSKLRRHLRIHTNDKPFVCNFPNCTKAFSDKRNLEGHKLTHVSDRKYACNICTKTFKTINRLKQHSKSHTSGVMYTCDLCWKKYKYKNNLISHMKGHNNICPYCKLNCESNTLLIEHLKICRIRR